ncbi:hypothetical protein ANN_01266 [Periplaneta americana]|uniref:HTH CENPB-type domain-containing protein n=1 Tax=Periplaneta americana TaxID=6978 RepID=A0ABQ8TT48_PERAM|nr:hypothetical protein ANN_01266 [Periplaneta americana]
MKKWIIDSCRKGFPRHKADVIASVKEFLHKRPNQFIDNTPGIGWYKTFLKRHPDTATRTSGAVTSANSCVSEKDIRN